MSEKNQKKKKVSDLNKNKKQKEKKSLGVLEVEVFDNGSVQVRGFPEQPAQAIQIMAAATIELTMYFIGKATMEAQSRIVKPGQDQINLVNQCKGNKDGLII